jgi:hypothetical protein
VQSALVSYSFTLIQTSLGGTAAATLHYMKNSEPMEGKLNLLLDAGAEYNCYASDIVSPPDEDDVDSILTRADTNVPNQWTI